MRSVLDRIMYGDSWHAPDATGRRTELYGPWKRALHAAERRRFPLRELWDVRRAMRQDGEAPLGFMVYGPLVVAVAMGAVLLLPLEKETEGWVLAAALLMMVLMFANGALSVPAAPAAFARAMIREGRCPACASGLDESIDGIRKCDPCGTVWRAPRPAPGERGAWECVDDRGRAAKLYRPGITSGRMDEGFRKQFKSIRGATLGGDTRRAYFSGMAMGIFAVYYTSLAVKHAMQGPYWIAMIFGAAALAMLANGVHVVRWGVGDDSRRFLRAMLEHGRCPACAYDISDSAVEADGCTVCAECGAAWRLAKEDSEG